MEEDIKILEQSLLTELYGHDTVIVNKKALENLIKGYRELEEENEGLKLDRRNLLRGIERITQTTPLNMRTETNYSINIDNNTIPKSKIKEILGRLNISDIEPWTIYKVNGQILFDLQELLEDK